MEKKQTAVNFYIDEYRKLEISHNLSEITIGQFASKIIKLQRQAMQMERQQIREAFEVGMVEPLNDYPENKSELYYYNKFKP